MFLTIASVLSDAEIASIRAGIDALAFVDGKATAGWSAKLVKANRQAVPGAALSALQSRVESVLRENALFVMAVRPKKLTSLLFARYAPGETYGSHVDDALMHGMRTRRVVHAVPVRPGGL